METKKHFITKILIFPERCRKRTLIICKLQPKVWKKLKKFCLTVLSVNRDVLVFYVLRLIALFMNLLTIIKS